MAIFEDFITLKEAGSISGYHPDYIGALIRSNKVKGKKIGKNWYVSKKEVQEYLATKHYVSAEKVVSSRAKVLFILITIVVVIAGGAYVISAALEGSSAAAQSVPVKSNLSDTVDPQTGVSNTSANVAQQVPTAADASTAVPAAGQN
jgi:hypothetical protein